MSTPQPPAGDPYAQGPQDPYQQAPQAPYGQAPQNPYGQAPQNPYGQNPYGGTALQAARPRPSVSFGQAISLFFKNYAVFNGRASRSEFWWVMLFTWAVNIIVSGLANAFGGSGDTILTSLDGLWGLAILVPTLAISWRRLHDTGRSGGWWFINLIPLIGTIIFIVFTAGQSRPDAWQRFDNGKLPVES